MKPSGLKIVPKIPVTTPAGLCQGFVVFLVSGAA